MSGASVAHSAPDWLRDIRVGLDHVERLAELPYFAEHCLKLRPKTGGTAPFLFNPAQGEVHRRLEEQLKNTGRVRAIILKARQMGVSTYVAARFYRRVTANPGLRCQIIGHERRASSNLYGLVRRFHDLMPDDMRPSIGTSNAEELVFDKLDSGYLVSVANPDGAGRSSTAQLLHGSEVGFWANLHEQLAAMLQTIPDADGTEVILESTGNTFGDQFHQFWCSAQAGENDFLPIFLPWSIDPTYRSKVPADFAMTAEEVHLAELHGLDAEQIYWRRRKIGELRSVDLFQREYPLTPSEAFMASSFDSFIPLDLVMTARKQRIDAVGPLVIGVDPAGQGADATAIAWRRGSCIEKIEKRRGLSTMEVAGWVGSIIRQDKPDRVSIDVGGLGVGVADRLEEQGHKINRVNFGGKPIEPAPLDETGRPGGGPLNRRAEMWETMKQCLAEGRFALPDSDSLMADLCSVGYRYDSAGRLVLESKQDLRRRGMPSPDEGDAAALCFAVPGGAAFVQPRIPLGEPDYRWVV